MDYQALTDEIDLQNFAMEMAKNQVGEKLPVPDLLKKLGVAEEYFLQVANNELFQRYVQQYTKELQDSGMSFKLKCRVVADDPVIKRLYRLMHDPDTPAAVTAKIAENFVRWAELEPKTTQQSSLAAGTGFNIIFNIPELPKSMQVIDITPTVSAITEKAQNAA